MKLALILPKFPPNISEHFHTSKVDGVKRQVYYPLALPLVAALSSNGIDIKIIDENIEAVNYDEEFDLVGISITHTPVAPRGYEIAKEFKKRGVKVVLGGIHVSSVPEEARKCADTLALGEAESTWPKVIKDFFKGKLNKVYKTNNHSDISKLPIPRTDLLKRDNYVIDTVQISRGCPRACSFCVGWKVFGKKRRERPIDEIIDEIREIKSDKIIYLVDDDIFIDRKRAEELFQKLIPLKIRWQSDVSCQTVRDEELLKLARKSGCNGLSIGFESIRQKSLEGVHKTFNRVDEYEDIIKMMQKAGISIMGSFIFGFDHDDENIFDDFLKFAERTKMESFLGFILTPYPGTSLYEKLKREGRLIENNWEKYDSTHVVFQPKLLSPKQLYKGMMRVWMKSQDLWRKYYPRYLK